MNLPWVSFLQAGQLVVGAVLCRVEQKAYPWKHNLITTAGIIEEDAIIERRNPPTEDTQF